LFTKDNIKLSNLNLFTELIYEEDIYSVWYIYHLISYDQ